MLHTECGLPRVGLGIVAPLRNFDGLRIERRSPSAISVLRSNESRLLVVEVQKRSRPLYQGRIVTILSRRLGDSCHSAVIVGIIQCLAGRLILHVARNITELSIRSQTAIVIHL